MDTTDSVEQTSVSYRLCTPTVWPALRFDVQPKIDKLRWTIVGWDKNGQTKATSESEHPERYKTKE